MTTLTDRLTEAVIADAADDYRRERMRAAIREHIEAAMQDSTFSDERADDLAQISAAHAATEVGADEPLRHKLCPVCVVAWAGAVAMFIGAVGLIRWAWPW
ncbi:MAG TPA: hypothetical protein PLB26_19835 [Rubrivivax sp.]|nr:hypothetical protein [Rubrivivax sp.]